MPEGDTIFRAARSLERVLGGQRVVTCESTVPAVTHANFAGHTILRVEPRGKNLLFHFDDGRALHTHMRMTGSWHIYRVGERWLKRTQAARIVLTTQDSVAVCFSAPVVRVIAKGGLARDAQISELGPDLLDPKCDLDLARENLRRDGDREIGDALMQQRLVAGIGNVYKSETLFACRTDPFARVSSLDDATLGHLLDEARTQLLRNTKNTGPRVTRARLTGPRSWVYLRAREPCLVCGQTIALRYQGTAHRSTYFCSRCQGVSAGSSTAR